MGHQEAGNGFRIRVGGEGGSVSGSVIRVGAGTVGFRAGARERGSKVGCWLVSGEG